MMEFPYYLVYFKAFGHGRYNDESAFISILFSLFQSLFLNFSNESGSFHFHTIQSISKRDRQGRDYHSRTSFPYYLVYFKARLILAMNDFMISLFPYYLVYFKASLITPLSIRQGSYFHTIQSISKPHPYPPYQLVLQFISILFSLFQSADMSHKPLETSIISILFSLFQSIPGYDEGIQFRVISILFSLFQSNSSNAAKNVNEGRFPYYLVYFKANRNRRTKRDRRSISILFSLFQSLEEVTKFFSNKKEFPYYLVYFKALLPQGCGYV